MQFWCLIRKIAREENLDPDKTRLSVTNYQACPTPGEQEKAAFG